ncbi:MAG: hypothetical protein IJ730_06215, partial [Alphaproteobacteria bacterium]|nr:hypothetical protein [Alphaproteobacteria bacterium]
LEEEDFNAKCISYIHAFYQKQQNQNQFLDKYETIINRLPKLAYITDDSNALDGWINYLPSSYISLYQYVGESRPLYQGLNETCPEHTFNPFIFYSIIFGDFSKAIAELTGVTPVWDSINQRYSDYFAVKEGSYSIIKRDGYLITKKSILYPYALRATELLILRLRTLFRLPAFDDKFFMAHIPSINDNVRIIYNNQSKGMLITEKICELEGSTIKNQYEKVKSWCNEIINLQSFNQRIFRECSNHMISYIPMLLDFCKVNISPQEFFDSNIMPDDYKEIDIPLNRFDKFFARYYKKINEIFNTFHQDNIEKNPNKMLVHAFSDITSIANNSISGHRIDTVYYLCAKYRFLNSNSSRQQTWIQAESVFNTLGNITDQIVFACQVRDAIFPTISLKNFLHNYVVDMNNENCSHVRTDEEVAQMIFTTHLSSSRKNLSNFSDKSSETSSISSSSSTSYKIIPFIEEAFNDIQNDSRLLKDILPPPQILYEKVPQ